ncbi:MAG TPA: hypothetical protein VN368_00130 [Candidatus Methylomirabilis sp.]|nr:hypothetical protein [Candidatus Methylomirabilis sp.]
MGIEIKEWNKHVNPKMAIEYLETYRKPVNTSIWQLRSSQKARLNWKILSCSI